jgi:hypothetical protein
VHDEHEALRRAWERVQARGLLSRHLIKRQHGAWDVEYFVEERDHGSEVIAIQVTPHGCPRDDRGWPVHGVDSPPLTRRELRDIPLGPEIIPREVINPEDMQAAGVELPAPFARGQHRPDLFYAQIAQLYVTALERHSRTPVATVARQAASNGAPYSRDTIRDFLNIARRRGLLTRPRAGQAGGKLTEKAIELLRSDG